MDQEKRSEHVQHIHIPTTGETVEAQTFTGKELLFNDPNMTDAEYEKLWEDDRL
ncbi:hypothetical protein [Brevibacillus dissolubilis]|uniref:hypothetical protein n=1 Tax=Brevibacillus dissolubilis TaxID=1844116 RepID=UPI00159BE529|nr:hypothetical protein [Brevibacillus dissolubilis]